MTSYWIYLETDPPLALVRRPEDRRIPALEGIQTRASLTGLGTLRRPLSIPGIAPGEAPNVTASLDNADGWFTARWRDNPPLRTVARIQSDTGELFAGIVTDISLGAEASITLEAGFVRPLSDKLPLRKTTEWGEYQNVRTLPVPYGRVTLAPVRYDDAGSAWVVADGAIAGVDSVEIDGTANTAWTWRNGIDRAGKPVAFLEFTNPAGADADVAVTMRGRIHPQAGHLMTAPDEILWDVLANVAGLGTQAADLDAFRSEVVGLEIGGVLDDADKTIRAQVDTIIQSIGGAWSIAADGIAMLWPFADTGDVPTKATADRLTMQDITVETHHGDLANVLRIQYAHDWHTGEPAKTLEIENAESIREYGRIESDWDAGWCRTERQAQALGARILAALSAPRWSVSWQSPTANLAPGDWLEIDHPLSPVAGRAKLVDSEQYTLGARATLRILS